MFSSDNEHLKSLEFFLFVKISKHFHILKTRILSLLKAVKVLWYKIEIFRQRKMAKTSIKIGHVKGMKINYDSFNKIH